MTVHLRQAEPADVPCLTAIYNFHVENSDATFDEVPASMVEREKWFNTYAATGPHQLLVAEVEGEAAGYACSSPYRAHPAFSQTVETSIYLGSGMQGRGLGKSLYDALLLRLAAEGVHLAVAGVALPNDASVALHRSRGFREVGTFTEYAVKRGKRISSSWFEKLIVT
ncbi:MAG: phosphinothricin acetyltransferase [Cryptosporangiaceae bacterium]|nr:phosphinothricin acetyltransferase [Cryptosporangiaceae bacterium]